MVHLSDPLRHAVVISVFGFEQELKKRAANHAGETANPTIGTEVLPRAGLPSRMSLSLLSVLIATESGAL